MTTCVRLYLSIYHHRNNAAWQHIKDIGCRNNVIKRCVLLIWHQRFESRRASLGPTGRPEYCHHFALCRCHQNAELQQAKQGWVSSTAASEPDREATEGLTERRNHSNGTTTWQGVDFHSLIVINALLMKRSLHDYMCQAISFHISP